MSYTISRINPDAFEAIPVSGSATADILAMAPLLAPNGYVINVNCSIPRVEIDRTGSERQFAGPGDWLVVTEATVDTNGQWSVLPTSQLLVYSATYIGVAGTVDQFYATFTGANLPPQPSPAPGS